MTEGWRKLTATELEKEMSPSRWNSTKTPDEVLAEHIQKSITATGVARNTVGNKLNLRYGPLPLELLDIYGTDLLEDSPIFFSIHGGYWQEGSKEIAGGLAVLNHKIGIKTVVFGYTLAPNAKIQAMEQEVVEGLKFVNKMFARSKLILGGHSAGAQLAASLLHNHTPSLPKEIAEAIVGFVFISGVFDLRPLVHTYVNDPLRLDMDEAERLSGLLLPFKNGSIQYQDFKTLVLVGGHDSPEFQRQSLAYFRKLKENTGAGKNSLYVSESDDHFTIVENLAEEYSDVYQEVCGFLKHFVIKE